jgi:hypothetical protein
MKDSAKKRLLDFLLRNVEKEIDRDTLRDVAQVHDWQRTIRTLRQIDGYDIEATAVGYIL